MTLTIKKINSDSNDISKVKSLYCRAFPRNERRSFNELANHRIGNTELFVFYDRDLFVGMAVTMNSPDITHLVYLAIDDNLRGKGYGTQALALLHKYYAGKRIIADIERPNGTSDNEKQRTLRKQFYLRAGYAETEVKYRWRNEDYEILSFGGAVSKQDYDDFWDHLMV